MIFGSTVPRRSFLSPCGPVARHPPRSAGGRPMRIAEAVKRKLRAPPCWPETASRPEIQRRAASLFCSASFRSSPFRSSGERVVTSVLEQPRGLRHYSPCARIADRTPLVHASLTGAARRTTGPDWPRTGIVGTPRPLGSRSLPRAGSR